MPLDYTARSRSREFIGPKPLRSNFPWWLIAPNLTAPTPETPAVAKGQMRERQRRAARALIAMDKVRRANRQNAMRVFVAKPRRVA